MTGQVVEKTFRAGEKVAKATLDRREMQYLYKEGSDYVMMDNETYEQIEISKERLEWEKQFLKGDEIVEITSYEGEILGISLPAKVALQIVECDPAVRGDTVNKAMKDAVLETGLKVRVPLFINNGEVVLVRTDNGDYDGRA